VKFSLSFPDPVDVPKLGVKMDYKPPELLYNQLYQQGETAGRPPPPLSRGNPVAASARPTSAPFLPTPGRFAPRPVAKPGRLQQQPTSAPVRAYSPPIVRTSPLVTERTTPVPVYVPSRQQGGPTTYSRPAEPEPLFRGAYPPARQHEDLDNEIDTGGQDYDQIQFHKRMNNDDGDQVGG
jgi:hypothetical protein